jgi:hypothetical protein
MDAADQKYRHELKYLVSAAQIPLLKTRIASLMQRDPHAGKDGIYTIRSLYFDDYCNRCYYENENGTDPREKYRIRIYNHSDQKISLECKRKERGKTLKTACPLTRQQTEQLIRGEPPMVTEEIPPLLRKFAVEMKTRRLRPVVIVEYERIPYIYKNGNVRVTFDTQIASSSDVEDFFSETLSKRPVMPVGQQLLEVKFDEYLPDFIYRNLNLNRLQQTAFSKFYLCRKYSLHK